MLCVFLPGSIYHICHILSTLAAKEDNFTVCQLSPTCRVGIPFNMVLQIKDCYGHPTPLSSDTKPVLKCRWVSKQTAKQVSSCYSFSNVFKRFLQWPWHKLWNGEQKWHQGHHQRGRSARKDPDAPAGKGEQTSSSLNNPDRNQFFKVLPIKLLSVPPSIQNKSMLDWRCFLILICFSQTWTLNT